MRSFRPVLAAILLTACGIPASAQTFETVGTRAAGMGGAFVAVADDASAAFWNPGAFASGSFFSLVLDKTTGELTPPGGGRAAGRSGLLMALGSPALALSYYRLRASEATPTPSPESVEATTLVTHHTGVTLVQSLFSGLTVGATVKLVRGLASSGVRSADERDELVRDRGDLTTEGTTRVDADLGVMATLGKLKAGLTVRNASEPSFASPGGRTSLKLERQARAGLSLTPVVGWIAAVDLDVLASEGAFGSGRRFAAGTEGRIHRKAFLRGGYSMNTSGGRAPAGSLGASFAATGSLLVDVQVTRGTDRSTSGWGVAARFGY